MDQKRLYKARGHRMVCGVCGGIAEYFGVDPTIVRLAFVLLCFGWGSGLLAYIVAALIMPEPPYDPNDVRPQQLKCSGPRRGVPVRAALLYALDERPYSAARRARSSFVSLHVVHSSIGFAPRLL